MTNSIHLGEMLERVGRKLRSIIRYELLGDPVTTKPFTEDVESCRYSRACHRSDFRPTHRRRPRTSIPGRAPQNPDGRVATACLAIPRDREEIWEELASRLGRVDNLWPFVRFPGRVHATTCSYGQSLSSGLLLCNSCNSLGLSFPGMRTHKRHPSSTVNSFLLSAKGFSFWGIWCGQPLCV